MDGAPQALGEQFVAFDTALLAIVAAESQLFVGLAVLDGFGGCGSFSGFSFFWTLKCSGHSKEWTACQQETGTQWYLYNLANRSANSLNDIMSADILRNSADVQQSLANVG